MPQAAETPVRTAIPLIPVERMWQRVENARNESDTAYFHDLLYLGELLAKLTVSAVLALIEDDRERLRYRHVFSLLRASGIGDWDTVLAEALTGPSAQHFTQQSGVIVRDLTQKLGEGSWQFESAQLLQEAISIIDVSHSQQPGKTDGKRWITLFAQLRNKTRGHGAPTGAMCSKLCPIIAKAFRIVSDGSLCFKQEWAYIRRNLSGKYRVTPLAGTGEPFDDYKLKDTYKIPDGVYMYVGTERLVELADSDVDASDFFLANGDFRERKFEMLSYISGAHLLKDGSAYLDPIGKLPGSETAGIEALDLIGETFTNLPPPPDSYVSRPALEQELLTVINGDRYPVITLVGRGGIGKTSLALKTLHAVAKDGGFALILWFSARDLDLLPEGPKHVKPAVVSVRDMASEVVSLLAPPKESLKGSHAAEDYLSAFLTKSAIGPTLFVFDNFETVVSPIELYRWLDTHIRLPNKILITTRQRDFKGDYPLDVPGMNEKEFGQLVDETANRLGIAKLLSEPYRDDLFKESDGHPYVVKILLGEVAKAGKALAVGRIVADQEEILTALFERTYVKLSPAAQRIFLTLSSWRTTLPQLAIEAVYMRPTIAERLPVKDAIDELQRSSFIEIVTAEIDNQAFVVTPLAACLFGAKKASVSPMKAAIETDLSFLMFFGAGQRSDIRHGIGPRVDALIRSIATRVEDGIDPLATHLEMLEFIARHHRPAWLSIAKLQEEAGDGDNILAAAGSVRQYLEDAEGPSERVVGWRRLARLYRRLGDIVGEMHALIEMAEVPGAEIDEVSDAANRVNMLLSILKENRTRVEKDERLLLVQKMVDALEKRRDEMNATDLSRLAWLKTKLGDNDGAIEIAKIGLELEPENEYCKNLIAKVGTE